MHKLLTKLMQILLIYFFQNNSSDRLVLQTKAARSEDLVVTVRTGSLLIQDLVSEDRLRNSVQKFSDLNFT